MKQKPHARAVLISDVHFNVNTLPVARQALDLALNEAWDRRVPLIIAGDLNDTKAILRGEVANALIQILERACVNEQTVYLLVGNHDLINEKGQEHTLNFLRPYTRLIQHPVSDGGFNFIPYQTDPEAFLAAIRQFPEGSTVICHQGFKGAKMGEYVVDKTSIDPADVAEYRVVSGHYHEHQTIGTVTYIGTPYSITFAEANDPYKGVCVLMSDGSVERVGLKLRRHIVVVRTPETVMDPIEGLQPTDLLWVKVEGPATALQKLNKKAIGERHLGHQNFKLDKVYKDIRLIEDNVERMTGEEVFDRVIEDSDEPAKQKRFLKQLWRDILAT